MKEIFNPRNIRQYKERLVKKGKTGKLLREAMQVSLTANQ